MIAFRFEDRVKCLPRFLATAGVEKHMRQAQPQIVGFIRKLDRVAQLGHPGFEALRGEIHIRCQDKRIGTGWGFRNYGQQGRFVPLRPSSCQARTISRSHSTFCFGCNSTSRWSAATSGPRGSLRFLAFESGGDEWHGRWKASPP